jgi:DNA-binding MarR family transcriptional regulator
MNEELDRERARQAAMMFVANTRRHKRLFRKFVSELGIGNSQHRLLMHLHRTQCAPSQTELARTFEVSTAAITASLKKLEKNGYIRRCVAVEDGRYNEIAITEKYAREYFCVNLEGKKPPSEMLVEILIERYKRDPEHFAIDGGKMLKFLSFFADNMVFTKKYTEDDNDSASHIDSFIDDIMTKFPELIIGD